MVWRTELVRGNILWLAIEKKLQIEAKIKNMKVISRALDGLIADCANETRPVEDCPILAAFDRWMSRA